jgi:hypothetical protein
MFSKRSKLIGLSLISALWAGQAVSGPLLYDVNDRTASDTQSGWTEVNLDGVNGVTFTGVGGVFLDDRNRGTANTNGAGGDTDNNDMWKDFIFADERGVNVSSPAGVDITVSGLLANTFYDVRLWAFDDLSDGGRYMTWNGVALSIPNTPDPASLDSQLAEFTALSDASGNLLLEGRIGSPQGTCCNVFVNGFELTAVPEPGTLSLLGIGLMGLGFARRYKKA